jgi:hypothetical protein
VDSLSGKGFRLLRPGTTPSLFNPPRHGRTCAGHPDHARRGAPINRDHRHKAGDDVEDVSERLRLFQRFP